MAINIKAVKPKRPAFLIDGLIVAYKHAIISGGTQLHRDCFLADMLFTMAYGNRFHGRGTHPVLSAMQIVYVGKAVKLNKFLWAWNQDRCNPEDECSILCIPTPDNVEELKQSMRDIYALDTEKPLVVATESNLGFNPPIWAYTLHKALVDLSSEMKITSIMSIDPIQNETGNQAIYHSDTHIKLDNDLKDGAIIVSVMKNELNDFPTKFALAKRVIDCVMVLTDSNLLDESVTLLYEFKSSGIRERIRVIDILAAMYGEDMWPKPSTIAKVLGTTTAIIEPALKRLQNMGYIDRDTCTFTPKGKDALRNHGLLRLE